MAEVTEEDLDKKRHGLEKLREQIAEAHASRESREQALSNEISMKQLDAEEARLRAELAAAREAAKASTVKSGTADLLDTITDEQKAAEASAKAAEATSQPTTTATGTAAAVKSATKTGKE